MNRGEMSEWSIVRHSKCRVPNGTQGSNPCLSARNGTGAVSKLMIRDSPFLSYYLQSYICIRNALICLIMLLILMTITIAGF